MKRDRGVWLIQVRWRKAADKRWGFMPLRAVDTRAQALQLIRAQLTLVAPGHIMRPRRYVPADKPSPKRKGKR